MAKKIQNISAEPYQRHVILLPGDSITLTLRFYSRVEMWTMDVVASSWAVYGVKISLGVFMIGSSGKNIDFVCRDMAGAGLDPFRLNDFSDDRCRLYLLDEDDLRNIAVGEPIV